MESSSDPNWEAWDSAIPLLDLNELLLEHPAASFVFRCDGELLIADRAGVPHEGSLVLVLAPHGFAVEPYSGQESWGVVTYLLHKIS
jgi:hypothetical protein